MYLAYPADNYETFESSCFLLGSVQPGSSLTLNQKTIVPVSSEGYFSWQVFLKPGLNSFKLVSETKDGQSSTLSRNILRLTSPVLKSLPHQSDEIMPFVYPFEDIGIHPGESILLCCPAPSGSKVFCRIDRLMSRTVEMIPAASMPDNREGVFGQLHQIQAPWPDADMYMMHVHIPLNTPPLPSLHVHYSLMHDDQNLQLTALGVISVLPVSRHSYGITDAENTIVRTAPVKGSRKTPLIKNTILEITGFYGKSFRVRYSASDTVWIAKEDIQILNQPIYPFPVPVYLIRVIENSDGFELYIPLQHLVPIDIKLETYNVKFKFYGALSYCDFIHYTQQVFAHGLKEITWTQVNYEVMEIEVGLTSPLNGFNHVYDSHNGIWTCNLRTEQVLTSKPFVVVIDPGHGGEEKGAVAPDGTSEKDLNLNIGLAIQKELLKEADINIILTRNEDKTLSLEERCKIARNANANLFLSLHHNALPDGRDPMLEQGVATFYYYPYVLPFARHFQQILVKETDFSDYGVLYDSLHICRNMEVPSILLELGFLTHPEDAWRCLDKHHQNRVIKAICNAIASCRDNSINKTDCFVTT